MLIINYTTIKSPKYYHGDIKPSNYLYLNPEKYVLIDLNASGKIDDKNINQKIGTYPYIPPEVNKFCEIDKKNDKKRDLWSVGIILLFFMSKNNKIFENILKQKLDMNLEICQEEKSLFQYSILYGINISKIKKVEKLKYGVNFHYYNKYFIDNNYDRDKNEKVNAIDLIKKLLKIEIKERISIEEALMHKFFENMNDVNNDTIKYYKEIITKDRLKK